jgi:hypothetical protein
MLEAMRSAALAEVVVHGLHLALFGAGVIGLGVLLWVSRPRRPRPPRRGAGHERARVEALRAAARAGVLTDGGVGSAHEE